MRIELSGLSKSFGDHQVLDNIDFQVETQTLAIIGPSGGGKSTLLRLLGGLLTPTTGCLRVNGVLVPTSEKELAKYRASLGFVFQDGGLFHHWSALQNIAKPLEIVHGFKSAQAISRASELLERFDLTHLAHQLPAKLSGGQRQRVAIARAVAGQPKFLLLDEPTSALDPEYTSEVLSLLNDLRCEGTNFVVVTHEMGFARHACEQVAFLAEGCLLESGISAEVFKSPSSPQLASFLSKLLEWNV